MPNTTIQIKKSTVAGAVPTWDQVANGELAINLADGKLFYRNSTSNAVSYIANGSTGVAGNDFGTVNANGTIIVADTPGDVLTIIQGIGITIIGDSVGDNIVISTASFDAANGAFLKANTIAYAYDAANGAFLKANSIAYAYDAANGAFLKANTIAYAYDAANGAFLKANTIAYSYDAANGAFALANNLIAAFTQANTSNSMTVGNTPAAGGVYTTRSFRTKLNFIAGSNITLNVEDDAAGDRANIMITSTGGSGGGVYANISDSAPANPSAGQMWYNSANGLFFIYYNDGTSSQWVQTDSPYVANVINSDATVVGNLYILGSISDQFGNIRDLPFNEQTGAAYVLRANDVGRVVQISANTTIPNAVFSMGQAITLVNNSSATQNIVNADAVMVYMAGTSSNGVRQLAQRGVATILCAAANTFYISGAGLT